MNDKPGGHTEKIAIERTQPRDDIAPVISSGRTKFYFWSNQFAFP
jgi:hypothetical protein